MFSSSLKLQGQVTNRRRTKRYWLFQATDFQSLMYPCFIFSRILGIFPYNINASDIGPSKSYYFLPTIVICAYYFYTLIIIKKFFEWLNVEDERKIIEIICLIILYNVIIIVTFVSSGPRMRLLQKILKISSRLSSKMYRKQSLLIHFKDIFGFLFLVVYMLIFAYYIPVDALIKVYFFYGCLLMFQMDMLYINCVCILKACFKGINNDLANVLGNYKTHHVKWINYKQRNLFLLMELKALKKQHLMISDTVQELNRIFSPQMLATIALTFIHVTFKIYFKFVHWQDDLSDWINQNNYITMYYIACLIVKIALITWACETGKNQAKNISTTIHDVLNSTNDEKIKNELRVFSLQILHRDNTFSAKGLTIDASLFSDMIGTVTTYILILIQFLYALNSCNGKTVNIVAQST